MYGIRKLKFEYFMPGTQVVWSIYNNTAGRKMLSTPLGDIQFARLPRKEN